MVSCFSMLSFFFKFAVFLAHHPTPSFYSIHFINWCAKCVFSFSQDCFLLSGSLSLEALLIGVHCKKRYVNLYIQYNTIGVNYNVIRIIERLIELLLILNIKFKTTPTLRLNGTSFQTLKRRKWRGGSGEKEEERRKRRGLANVETKQETAPVLCMLRCLPSIVVI